MTSKLTPPVNKSSAIAISSQMLLANLLQDAWGVPRPLTKRPMVHTLIPTGIDSLPVELLASVFINGSAFDCPYANSPFLLKPDKGYVPPPVPCTNFALTASHVCRHWRQVALRTHQLWTTIHVREKAHISRAQEYLARCATSHMDILIDTVSLSDHTPGITLYKDELEQIFNIIVPSIKFWRSFHLKVCDNECKGVARQYLSTCGGAHSLVTLQLYHFEQFQDVQHLQETTKTPPVTIFNNDLPRLKNLSLIGVNLPWDRTPFLSELDNLQFALHSEKVRPTYEEWAGILRKCPGMRTLTLHYSGPKEATGVPALAWPTAGDEPGIVLRQLEDLNITDLDPDYLCALVGDLHIPAVTRMSLNLREQDFTPFVDFLLAAAESTSADAPTPATVPHLTAIHVNTPLALSRLQFLAIHGMECEYSKWVALLRALPALRYLDADFSRIPAGYYKAIGLEEVEESTRRKHACKTCPADKPCRSMILPRLEVFKVSGLSGQEILQVLWQRHQNMKAGQTRQERWFIRWSESKRGEDPELDALVDQGFWCPQRSGSAGAQSRVLVEVFDEPEEEDDEEGYEGAEEAEEAPLSAEDEEEDGSLESE
ncbi:hypothetical protein D9619_007061 [Psilocybe cf. subviscida]|uniref:F-box domain-containing protein n=1 Tax=Psilocybe cf. subviscida TaxID=2480587 RepID=A0A8H5EWQ7_9AGAR|nr:hypothetical protein D9619_007061 [Psilocybe cf. subviscida]